MGKSKESPKKSDESGSEKTSRVLRNINALGAVALGGMAVIAPVGANVLGTLAGINAAEALGFEWLRRNRKKKRQKKESKDNK